MKRSKTKDAEQVAKGKLRASPAYAQARTELAQEQTRRIEQIRKRDERELIPSAEVRDLLVSSGNVLRATLLLIAPQLRARHPTIDPAILAAVEELHRRALGTLSDAVMRLGDDKAPEPE